MDRVDLESYLRECPADVSRLNSVFIDNSHLRECIKEICVQSILDDELTACQRLALYLIIKHLI